MKIQEEEKRIQALTRGISVIKRKTDAEILLIQSCAEKLGNGEEAEEAEEICKLLRRSQQRLSEATGALMSAAGMCRIFGEDDESFYKALQTV